MKKNKNRFAFLLVGILIGFLVAWSVIWWQGNSGVSRNLFKNVKNYFSNLFSNNDKEDYTLISDNNTDNNKYKPDPLLNPKPKTDSVYFDSTGIDLSNPDALDEFLAMYNGELPDSSLFDSILKNQKNVDINNYNDKSSGDIKVKKDKLIYAKYFTIPGLEEFFSNDKIDSLLIDENVHEKSSNKLLVEFWKSPINYKGYKTNKNKLVLFGIDQLNMISFKMQNKILYMKYTSDYYQIDRSVEFKSLIPLNNPNIISQLSNR